VTDRTDPYEIIGVRRDASLAEIRISYRRSTQILAPERFASASETVRSEAARRLAALNGAMETIEAERAAESGSALGSLSFGGPAVSSAAEPSLRSTMVVDEPPPLAPPAERPEVEQFANAASPEVIHMAHAEQVEEQLPAEPGAPAPEEPPVAEEEPVAEDPEEPVAEEPEPPVADELVADEPEPPLAEEPVADEPEPPVVIEEPLVEEPAAEEPVAEEPEPPVANEPTEIEEVVVAEETTAVTTADTEDDLPAVTGEETAEVPIVPESTPEPAPELEPVFVQSAVAAPAPFLSERDRPRTSETRTRSLLPRILAGGAIVLALAAVGAYVLLGNDSGGGTAGGQFQSDIAPVSFTYPGDLVTRKPPQGGLLKPTFSTAVGVDAGNYVVVATYRISANVQADGSAVGTGGTRLTADRFDQSVDRAAERIASAQKLTAKGPVQPGKAGDLIARVYSYTRPGGSSALYAFAFRGHTEYSIACFFDPAHATAMQAACQQVMQSLQRTPA
jgi:hypothetical protein